MFNVSTVTTKFSGLFAEDSELRQRFMAYASKVNFVAHKIISTKIICEEVEEGLFNPKFDENGLIPYNNDNNMVNY